MKARRLGVVWTLALTLALVAAACGDDDGGTNTAADGGTPTTGASGPPLKMGVVQPFSGSAALYATEIFRGNELAVEEVNAKGGVLGRQVQLVKGDASTAEQATSETQRLVSREGVELLTGTYISTVSQAASQAAVPTKTLYWETNAASQILTDRNLPNFIRVGPDAIRIADQSTTFIKDVLATKLGATPSSLTYAIEHENSGFGTTIGDRQKKTLTELGAKGVTQLSHAASASDVTDTVLRAKNTNADVYILTGYVPDVVLILRTMRTQNWMPKAVILVGTGDTPDVLDPIGAKGMEGVFVVGYPRLDINPSFGKGVQAFRDAYVKKYGEEPKAPNGLTSYTGTKILFEAIEKAKSVDSDKVRAAALTIEHQPGTTPNGYGVKFDDHGANTLALQTVIQWQSGKPVTVFPPAAALAGAETKSLPMAGWSSR